MGRGSAAAAGAAARLSAGNLLGAGAAGPGSAAAADAAWPAMRGLSTDVAARAAAAAGTSRLVVSTHAKGFCSTVTMLFEVGSGISSTFTGGSGGGATGRSAVC